MSYSFKKHAIYLLSFHCPTKLHSTAQLIALYSTPLSSLLLAKQMLYYTE